MKYISRWAALLLAAMLVFSSASAELTLDGLTQDQLNALYASVSDEETTLELTGVLGEESSFTSSDAESWADLGYTLQWYAVDEDGTQTELTGETTATLDVVYTLEEQRFICTAYDADGAAFASTPTYIVAAQTADLDEYLNYLYEDQFLNDDGSTNKLAVYKQVTTTWNVTLSDGTNLAESVVAAWWAERTESYFDYELLCSCVVGSGVTSDDCVLHPYDEHYGTCGWYNTATVLVDETTGIRVTGDIPADVSLLVTGATGDMPEIDTSYMGETSVSPMLRSYAISLINADGDKYVLTDGNTVQVIIPGAWIAAIEDPIVDVYHVKDNGEVVHMSSMNDEVYLLKDSSVCFATDGFSDFVVVAGVKSFGTVGIGETKTAEIAQGATAKFGAYWWPRLESVMINSDEAGITAAISSDGVYLAISVSEEAEIGATATVALTFNSSEGTATIEVTVIEEEVPEISENATYTVDGSDDNSWTHWAENDTFIRYCLAPGKMAWANGYGNNSVAVSSDETVATVRAENGNIYVTATETAQVGETAKITITQDGIVHSIIYVEIVESDDPVPLTPEEKLSSEDYPIQLTIRTDGTIPNEPCVWDGVEYTYFKKSESDDTTYVKCGSNEYFASTANGVIKDSILDHELFYFVSRDGKQVIGMVDPTGVAIKKMLENIDWDALLKTAAEAGNITGSDGQKITTDNYQNYHVVPYVVKCQETDGKGWHIDCTVVANTAVHLSYDLNIPAGMTITTAGVVAPNNETGTPTATFTIKKITGMVDEKYIIVSSDYTFTFVEWNTAPDGSGDQYLPGTSIEIEQDTTLYAIWSISPEIGTGNLKVRKIVNDTAAVGTEEFKFSVAIPAEGEYAYILYGEDNVAISGGGGTLKHGGTFTLQNGQYIIVKGLPSKITVTVTETDSGDYTPAWSGGTANGNATSVVIKDGSISELTCTNSRASTTTTSLTVTKAGLKDGDSAIIMVEVDDKTYMLALSKTHSSDTIVNLPIDAKYTVTELDAWTWLYKKQSAVEGTLVTDANKNQVTITNEPEADKWLHDESSVINDLGTGSKIEINND